MGQVVIKVNGQAYTLQCADGEEDHLRDLGEALDAEVSKIRESVGQVGDLRLLLMSGLVIADRLSEAIGRVEALEEELQTIKAEKEFATRTESKDGSAVVARLDAASARIEALARDLNA